MNLITRLFTPVKTMIAIQLVWITLVVFWIYWFVGKHREFRELAEKYRPELLGQGFNWPVMVEGLVMLVLILAGAYAIFVFWNRQSALYTRQRDVIAQITHELKSPLASIQLHLETIRLRNPSAERLDSFVGTMLTDTERLHCLINNLLMAARLEKRRRPAERRMTDLSALVTEHVERERDRLPPGGSIVLEAESGLRVLIDPEEMGMVLRNLLENAILYSAGNPDITVRLSREGQRILLSVSDRGRGLTARDARLVFERFYRVRNEGENVRGTGLGLYIVEQVVQGYGGRVSAESPGPGGGSTFTITLPAE